MHQTSRPKPIISVVLATHNRRAVVENTLTRLDDCGLDRGDYETIVVDNASTDGTCDAVAHRVNRLIRLRKNAGSTAKAYGADVARGRYLLFLDDDSYPRPGSLQRMVEHFEADLGLAAAGFTVHLPSGRLEGGALPGVFVGCGVGLRTDAYRAVGGLDRTFFMQAEEYDLCFRLAGAGGNVDVFDDLYVDHLKTEHARRSERTTFYDTRNNLRVIARYLSAPLTRIYREDCVQRYSWLAEREGDAHLRAFRRGQRAGLVRGALERIAYRGRRLSPHMFERFFGWTLIRQRMAALARDGLRRVAFADLGKNIHPFHAAARELGVQVTAIADDRFAAPDRLYRGTPIVPVEAALDTNPDAVIVSNTAAVHAARMAALLVLKTRIPVHCWFSPARETAACESDSFTPPPPSDELHADPACAAHV